MSRTGKWWHYAACAGMDPELFSPLSGVGRGVREVLRLCDACPVREQCRDDMLEVRPLGPIHIIAGGWRWDHNGRPVPHPDDAARATELIAAASRRVAAKGNPAYMFVRAQANKSVRSSAA